MAEFCCGMEIFPKKILHLHYLEQNRDPRWENDGNNVFLCLCVTKISPTLHEFSTVNSPHVERPASAFKGGDERSQGYLSQDPLTHLSLEWNRPPFEYVFF